MQTARIQINPEDVKDRIQIEQYVAQFVPVKKKGSNYEACCPFHTEKHPSFKVDPTQQIFKCFGCDTGGDVFAFAMQYHNWDFPTALTELARYAGIDPASPSAAAPRPPRQPEPPALAEPPTDEWQSRALKVVEWAQKNLWGTRKGQDMLFYLTNTRGLSHDTIREARLGYVPHNNEIDKKYGRVLDEHWRKADGKPVYVPCGITIPHFAGGDLWAVRVRTNSGDPKYMGIAGGSKALYWADNVLPGFPLVIVEGEFDALAIWQAAMKWSGTLCPVALASASNWDINRRWWKALQGAPVVLARTDDDAAGLRALDGLRTITPAVRPVQVPIPGVKDCNDFLKTNGELALIDWLERETLR